MKVKWLIAIAQRLLREGTAIGEADRMWLVRRLDRHDWIAGDDLRVLEMMSPSLRACLTRFRLDEGPCR
jgi:hypothetical protein